QPAERSTSFDGEWINESRVPVNNVIKKFIDCCLKECGRRENRVHYVGTVSNVRLRWSVMSSFNFTGQPHEMFSSPEVTWGKINALNGCGHGFVSRYQLCGAKAFRRHHEGSEASALPPPCLDGADQAGDGEQKRHIGFGSSPSRCGSPYSRSMQRRRPDPRPPRFRCDPFARDVAFDPGRASAPRIAVPHILP